MTLQPGTGALMSPGHQADTLLSYDARLRCVCTASPLARCIRKATGEDRVCDDCRDGLHALTQVRYVTLPALRDHPDRVFDVLAAQRGHAVLVEPLGRVVDDGLTWP